MMPPNTEKDFWNNVKKTSKCWNWTGSGQQGYGRFYINRKIFKAHRYSWEISKGLIKKGLFVCHKCDNRKCVRPSHLFVGTQNDNVQDMVKKERNRWLVGERHPMSKLTDKKIKKIRALFKKNTSSLIIAKRYGVSYETIRNIVTKKSWTNVP